MFDLSKRFVFVNELAKYFYFRDISEELISQCLFTSNSPDPDLLVRTSGEVRLSDYLLWQSSFSVLAFFKVLWPEFSIWHLFLAVIFYQYNFPYVQVSTSL